MRQRLVGGAGGRDGDAGADRRRRAAGLRGAAQLGRGRRRAGGGRGREPPRAPVALALAVRPYTPEGLSVIERIDLHDGTTVTVDGQVALLLPQAAAAVAASTFHDGDSAPSSSPATRASAGPARYDRRPGPGGVRLPAGARRHAAGGHPARGRGPAPPPVAASGVAEPATRGAAAGRGGGQGLAGRRATGACGWCCPTTAWPRRWTPTAASCCCCTTATRSPRPATYHRFWFRDAAYLLGALDRYGYHDEVAQVLASYPGRQHGRRLLLQPAPRVGRQRRRPGRPGAEHWRLTHDAALAEGMVAADRQGRAVDRAQAAAGAARAGRRRADEAVAGLLPPGVSAEHLGPVDYFYWDDFWGVAGLRAGAELLRAADQPDAAADAEPLRRRHVGRRRGLAGADRRAPGHAGHPRRAPPPPRRRRHRLAGGVRPLDLLTADDERIVATADVIRERFTLAEGRAFYQGISHSGLGTYLTLQLAAVELRAGDRRCLDRLAWLLDVATPPGPGPRPSTPAWGRLHGRRPPRLGGGRAADVRARPAGAGGRREAAWRWARRWCPTAGTAGLGGARRPTAPRRASRTPCAGTATARRCCGSSSAARRRGPPVRLTAPASTPPGRRRTGGARRCSGRCRHRPPGGSPRRRAPAERAAGLGRGLGAERRPEGDLR